MHLDDIKTEIASLETFLKGQATRFAKIENEFSEGPKTSFLSDFHHELLLVVSKTKEKIENGESIILPNATTTEKQPEVNAEAITENKAENNSPTSNDMENQTPTPPQQPAVLFHNLSEPERIAFFINARLADLEGTGTEWNCVREWLQTQHSMIAINANINGAGDNFKESVQNHNERVKKDSEKAPRKKAAKKVAKKKAAKKK